jgi:hypothetical protein
MPFVPSANVALAEYRMELDAQDIEGTLYFLNSTGWDVAKLTDLNNFIAGWWSGSYATQCSADLFLREVATTDLTTATSSSVTLPAAADTRGDSAQPALPNNVALSVSFRTTQRGRSFRGRNYYAGLTEGQVLANTVLAGAVIAIREIFEELLTVADFVSDTQWVVLSRFSGVDGNGDPIPRAAGLATPINSVVVVDGIVDSMRRRLPGRGR